MSEATTESEPLAEYRGDVENTYRLLKYTYGLVPIVAGLDKFANLLTTWTDLLPEVVAGLLPVQPAVFMYVVGIVEIVAGIVVLVRTEYGAYVVAAWLLSIAAVLAIGGNFDVAVRDVVMAIGAIALAQLAAAGYGS